MTRTACALPLLCCFACSSLPSSSDAGPDAGAEVTEFNVSGTAMMFPENANLLADAGLPSTVAGLKLRVEEPFKIAINDNDPLGIFSTAYLDAGGEFSASQVSVDLVTLGVAAGIRDDVSPPDAGRVVRAATTLWDVALEGKKPDHDISGVKAWAVPTLLHDTLNSAITAAEVRSITDGGTSSLIEAGFILGRVVDAQGQGVAGATVSPASAVKGRFFYPNGTFTGTQASTSANGLFVYVHNGADVETFRLNVDGHTEYKTRQAGSAANACLVMTVYPGTTAP